MRYTLLRSALVLGIIATGIARAGVPEPDAVLYGTITLDGTLITATDDVQVIARVDGVPDAVGTYHMGDQADAGDQYVLRIRVESLVDGSKQSSNAALIGQTAHVLVKAGRGVEKPAGDFVLSERGITQQRNLVASTGDDCNGNMIADSLDVTIGHSKDCNGNGIPDECEPLSALTGEECNGQSGGGGGGGGGGPTDTDQDGVVDDLDACPGTPTGEVVDASGCAASQRDTDGDGVMDDQDQCADTPAGTVVDANGCTVTQPDADGDGVADDQDQCANTPAGEAVNTDGCAQSQIDTDGDGTPDSQDGCPNDANKTSPGNCGCNQPEDCVKTITINVAGPGSIARIADAQTGASIPVIVGTPYSLLKGTHIQLQAEMGDTCDLFLGWQGSVQSAEREIEIEVTDDLNLTAEFLDRQWVPGPCGTGACQAMAMALFGMALMRRRGRCLP